ncbi:MAG TPA: hypothetical protein VJ957_11345, partial [Longimicrobiales bacterium]|nr:hypothetical protein [Longimicrobiales bacterium]
MSRTGLFALLALLAFGGTIALYRRWEPRGPGRPLLVALRWAASLLVLLLLFNPAIPRSDERPARAILVDGSLSMMAPDASGRTPWQDAVARAGTQGAADVLVFGSVPRPLPAQSLGDTAPGMAASRLAPAIRAAAEEGARQVLVLSDGRIDDAAQAANAARDLGLQLDVVRVGGGRTDYAITEFDAPAWAEGGKLLEVRVGVAASDSPAADTALSVVLREDGHIVARGSVPAPVPGRVAALSLAYTPAPAGEDRLARLDAELAAGDGIPDDDRRVAYVRITMRPAVVLVSLHPDWEPRFLLPALQRALGLRVRGFLHVGGTRYLRLGTGPEAGQAVALDSVRRAAEQADLLVLHGMDDAVPAWARRAASRAPRVLVLPDTGAYRTGPLALGRPAGGEWYLSADVPASPVAALLGGLDVDGLPPLAGPRLLRLPMGWWTPLVVRRGRRGVDAPLLAVGVVGSRRIGVANAAGTWRWAFNATGSATYDRLWSVVAGWLMVRDRLNAGDAVRPASRVVARGAQPRWVAPGLALDSVAVRVAGANGARAQAWDTMVTLVNDTAATRSLAPGAYEYRARGLRHDTVVARASGPFSVASFSPDYTAPVVALEGRAGVEVARGSR